MAHHKVKNKKPKTQQIAVVRGSRFLAMTAIFLLVVVYSLCLAGLIYHARGDMNAALSCFSVGVFGIWFFPSFIRNIVHLFDREFLAFYEEGFWIQHVGLLPWRFIIDMETTDIRPKRKKWRNTLKGINQITFRLHQDLKIRRSLFRSGKIKNRDKTTGAYDLIYEFPYGRYNEDKMQQLKTLFYEMKKKHA